MSESKITASKLANDSVQITVSGNINENTVFPKFPDQKISSIILSLKDTQSINSMGILYWIRWWKELEKNHPGLLFQISDIRIQLLSCGSVVAGFLPEKIQILSFYLPYHNEEEAMDIQELYVKGDHYNDESLRLKSALTKNIKGKDVEFELDCLPDRDLRVLNLKVEHC